MKKFLGYVFAICIAMLACDSYAATALPPINVPASVPATHEPSTSASTLTEIPMRVGYGVRGSWFELYFPDPTNPATKQNKRLVARMSGW